MYIYIGKSCLLIVLFTFRRLFLQKAQIVRAFSRFIVMWHRFTQKCALSRLPNATNAVAVPFQWNTRPVHPLETLALNRGHRLSHAPQCISRANGHINPRANGLRRSTFANLGVIYIYIYIGFNLSSYEIDLNLNLPQPSSAYLNNSQTPWLHASSSIARASSGPRGPRRSRRSHPLLVLVGVPTSPVPIWLLAAVIWALAAVVLTLVVTTLVVTTLVVAISFARTPFSIGLLKRHRSRIGQDTCVCDTSAH